MRNWRKIIISILQAIWLPLLAYAAPGLIMIAASGHGYVKEQLKARAAPDQRTGLNMRLEGYDVNDVAHVWGVLDGRALDSERRFLQLDLLFPVFYAGGLLFALLRVWKDLGQPFSRVLILAPMVITAVADWTENLIHLAQLRSYVEKGKEGLQAGWIQIASAATTVKLILVGGMAVFLLGLAIYRAVRPTRTDSSRRSSSGHKSIPARHL